MLPRCVYIPECNLMSSSTLAHQSFCRHCSASALLPVCIALHRRGKCGWSAGDHVAKHSSKRMAHLPSDGIYHCYTRTVAGADQTLHTESLFDAANNLQKMQSPVGLKRPCYKIPQCLHIHICPSFHTSTLSTCLYVSQ